jgi:hypothetical protein
MNHGDRVLVLGTAKAVTSKLSIAWIDLGDANWPYRAIPAAPLLALIEASRQRIDDVDELFIEAGGTLAPIDPDDSHERLRRAVNDPTITALVKALCDATA